MKTSYIIRIFKVASLTILLQLTITTCIEAQDTSALILDIHEECETELGLTKVNFSSVRHLHNIIEDSISGMKIYINFDIHYAQFEDCTINVQFEDDNGNPLLDQNGLFSNNNGHVSVSMDFSPTHEFDKYSCVELFIPYSEFHLNNGSHDLSFKVEIIKQCLAISKSVNYHFQVKY